MFVYHIPRILFTLAITILVVINVVTLKGEKFSKISSIISLVSLLVIFIAWILEKKIETYLDSSYRNAYVTGRLAGGTVYASYPYATPGLGWIL